MNEELSFNSGVPFTYTYWDGAQPDARNLEAKLGPGRRVGGALYQACAVASGEMAFTVYPGNGAHDIAPSVTIVTEAGGKVTDLSGNSEFNVLNFDGAVVSNQTTHRPLVENIAYN